MYFLKRKDNFFPALLNHEHLLGHDLGRLGCLPQYLAHSEHSGMFIERGSFPGEGQNERLSPCFSSIWLAYQYWTWFPASHCHYSKSVNRWSTWVGPVRTARYLSRSTCSPAPPGRIFCYFQWDFKSSYGTAPGKASMTQRNSLTADCIQHQVLMGNKNEHREIICPDCSWSRVGWLCMRKMSHGGK